MPFPGVPNSLTAKMDKCVSEVVKTGKSEESAIAICKSRLVKSDNSFNSLMKKLVDKANNQYDKYIKSGQATRIALVEKNGKEYIASNPIAVMEAEEGKKEKYVVRSLFISNETSLNNNLPTGDAIKEEIDRINKEGDVFPIYRGHDPEQGKFGVWHKFWYEEKGDKVFGYCEGILDKRKSKVKDLWIEIADDGEKYGISWGGGSENFEIIEKEGENIAKMNSITIEEISIVLREANPDCMLEIVNKGQQLQSKNNNMSKKETKKIVNEEEEKKEEAPVEEVKEEEAPKEETPKEEKKEEPKEEEKVEVTGEENDDAPKEEEKEEEPKEEVKESLVSMSVNEHKELMQAKEELATIKDKLAIEEANKFITENFEAAKESMDSLVGFVKKLNAEERALLTGLKAKKVTTEEKAILATEFAKGVKISEKAEDKIKAYAKENKVSYNEATNAMRKEGLIK